LLVGLTVGFKTPTLSPLGDLPATWGLTATEAGAIAFGPIALATFDGSCRLTYDGPPVTVDGITVNPGDNLPGKDFLGSVFSGYGSTGSLVDSVSAGGLVSHSSDFLTFDPLSDQGFSFGFTSTNSPFVVSSGTLNEVSAVSQGVFAASYSANGGVPEPATWALLLVGLGSLSLIGWRQIV
jgi:hypothetical protein